MNPTFVSVGAIERDGVLQLRKARLKDAKMNQTGQWRVELLLGGVALASYVLPGRTL